MPNTFGPLAATRRFVVSRLRQTLPLHAQRHTLSANTNNAGGQQSKADRSRAVDRVIDFLSVICAAALGWVMLISTLSWSFTVLNTVDTDEQAGLHYQNVSHHISIWLILGVPLLIMALALTVNFGMGRYSIYYLRDSTLVSKTKNTVLNSVIALGVGALIAWLISPAA